MKRIALILTLLFGCAFAAHAQQSSACVNSVNYSSPVVTAAGNTQVIAPPTGTNQRIHVCYVTVYVVQGATATNWGLVSGTGTACSVGTSQVTPQNVGVGGATQTISQVYGSGVSLGLPRNTGLCLNLGSAAMGATVWVGYAIY